MVLKINNKVVIDLDLWQKFPANIRLEEDVLKTSFVLILGRRLQDIFRTSSSRRIYLPYSYVFRRCLQDVLMKTNILVLVIRLQDVFKTFSRRLQDVLPRRLQNVFKTSSKRPQDVFKTSSGHLQDIFKTYHQFKLFLLTRFQDVFEIYSKRFWDVLQRRLSIEGFA